MTVVPPYGPQPARILVVGEAPGAQEAKAGRPFVGASGKVQDRFLKMAGINPRKCRMANVVWRYRQGNPDPTPEDVTEWMPQMQAEIEATQPEVVVAVGRFAAQWFLGEWGTMRVCHGIPHDTPHSFGVVVPVYHPAAGLRNPEIMSLVHWGYEQVGRFRHMGMRKVWDFVPSDDCADRTAYVDVTGQQLLEYLRDAAPDLLGLDTEASSRNPHTAEPWSVQVSWSEGQGACLRCAQRDFDVGVWAIQQAADRGCTIALHNALYDMRVSERVGLDLSRAHIVDTMYWAYLQRVEPLGLKALAWRHCGMRMREYEDVVGDAALDQQLEYLAQASDPGKGWARAPERLVEANDGTAKWYRPVEIHKTAGKILGDYAAGKVTKEGPVNLVKRWAKVDQEARRAVEGVLGEFPVGTLDDVSLGEAVKYGCADSDATLRLARKWS